tara:strand:- start:932 stop:1222 length:291 start_codon:yes stop_codon:yes gene_type:complete
MADWLSGHIEVLLMFVGGLFSLGALLWRGASDTQKVIGSLTMIGHRLSEVEKSIRIASDSRAKLHSRIDDLASQTDGRVNEVRERVVVLETRVGGA